MIRVLKRMITKDGAYALRRQLKRILTLYGSYISFSFGFAKQSSLSSTTARIFTSSFLNPSNAFPNGKGMSTNVDTVACGRHDDGFAITRKMLRVADRFRDDISHTILSYFLQSPKKIVLVANTQVENGMMKAAEVKARTGSLAAHGFKSH